MAQGLKKPAGNKRNLLHRQKNSKPNNCPRVERTSSQRVEKLTHAKEDIVATKAINKKNEVAASAKAVGAGNTFFLQELKEAGTKEIQKQKRNQMRVEKKSHTLSSRLKDQLRKMGQDA
jgi:hypothetical protein